MPNRRTSKNISHRAKRKRLRLIQRTEDYMRRPPLRLDIGIRDVTAYYVWMRAMEATLEIHLQVPAKFIRPTRSNNVHSTP